MSYVSSNVKIETLVTIGSGAISHELSDMGYIATIGFLCDNTSEEYDLKDFNVTLDQLEMLRDKITSYLSYLDKWGN